MNSIIVLLAIFGLQFLIAQSDGPFGFIAKVRNWLMHLPHLNVFFFNLLSCPFCLGCWSGLGVYLLSQESYKLNQACLWVLTGGATCLLLDAVLSRLHRE